MEVIKKYTAIMLGSQTIVNNFVEPMFSYGRITGPYYSQTHPRQEFDTEEEAIKYAFETNEYIKWIILPTIEFKN